MLRVNTIYPGFMGEVNCHGIGAPCTFVRLAGCNLRCYKSTKGCLCDTPEALEATSCEEMSEQDILKVVKLHEKNIVCLTGGEPLLQDVAPLLQLLIHSGFKVVVETNGSVDIGPYLVLRNVSFVVDVKTSSSGESRKMVIDNYRKMRPEDVVKFVIDTQEDFDELADWITVYGYAFNGVIAAGLFWGSIMSYSELLEKICERNLNVHLNMQTHKMMCLYDYYKDNTVKDIFIPKNL